MAESPLARLKRLAAEKKVINVGAQPVVESNVGIVETKLAILSMQLAAADKQVKAELVELVTPNTEANLEARMQLAKEKALNEPARKLETGSELQTVSGGGTGESSQAQSVVETEQPDTSVSTNSNIGTSDHQLAMQFAELEAALLAQQPEFKTILRQIHRHLGQEPELVTQMTEQEIQMIVSGLVVFANAEIVAPAIVKTAKAAMTAAKKKVISADDL